jgi:copper chaperone CopZ
MCASTISAALKQNPNVKNVKVDVAGKTVTIDLVSGKTLDKAETERIIKKAGYTQTGFKSVCR